MFLIRSAVYPLGKKRSHFVFHIAKEFTSGADCLCLNNGETPPSEHFKSRKRPSGIEVTANHRRLGLEWDMQHSALSLTFSVELG